MKRFILIITFVCIASLSFFLFTECAVLPPGYYIKFKVDGVQKNYDKGLTDVEEKPFGIHWIENSTEIWANPNVVSNGDQIEQLLFGTSLIDVGTETEDYMFEYVTETGDIYRATSRTVTITTYESVGGVIEGTFSATVENIFPPGDLKEITEGEFRVKRIANDTNLW